MIKELHLTNWKSFEKGILYIDPLNILIGTNASGKSNVLDAFMLLYNISWGRQILSSVNGDNEMPPLRGGLDWVVRKGQSECEIKVLTGSDNEDVDYLYSIKLRRTNGSRFELCEESLEMIKTRQRGSKESKNLYYTQEDSSNSPSLPTYYSTATQGRGKRIDMSRSFSVLSQIETMGVRSEIKEAGITVLNNLRHIFILDPIPNHMRSYSKLSDRLLGDAANIAGVIAALPIDKKNEIENTLTRFASQLPENDILKIWSETVGLFKTDAMLYSKEQWTTSETLDIDARGMSDGTLRFLAIITALLTVKENSLLIIEEIDNGLHPSRAQKLVKMLHELGAQRKIDILCTTHNPALMDAFGNSMIPFISYVHRNKTTGSSSISLLEDFEKLPKLMAAGTLGDLMTSGIFEQSAERSQRYE
jgi:predicted ATPase